jgi:aspartyl protease family protein
MLGWLALIVAALVALFLLIQGTTFHDQLSVIDPVTAAIVAGLVVLTFAALKAVTQFSDRRGARLAAIAVAVVILSAAGFWFAKSQVPAILEGTTHVPADEFTRRTLNAPVSVLIRRNTEDNFVAQGKLSGADAQLLFDTGASYVMLKPSDAERAGIDVPHLSFTTPIETANGTVYAAPVRIRSITIGLLKVDDVEALVARPGSLNENLLGMSFLRRLASYDLKGDFLTLRE